MGTRKEQVFGMCYFVVDVNSLCIKYMSNSRSVLEEIIKNESSCYNIGKLVLVEHPVRLEIEVQIPPTTTIAEAAK